MAAGKEVGERDGRVSDQWRYCGVCRRNHEEGRKHIFTKQHKSRLSILMSKFTKKVSCTCMYINFVHVHALEMPF